MPTPSAPPAAPPGPPQDTLPPGRPDAALWSDQTKLSTSAYWRLLVHRTIWLLLSTALLAELSRRLRGGWWPVLAIPTAATVWWLGSGLRMRLPSGSRRVVRIYATILIVAGAGATGGWFAAKQWPWLLLTGVVVAFIGADAWLTSLRWQYRGSLRLPVGLACATGVLTLVAALLRSSTSTVWPIVFLALAGLGGYLTLLFGVEPWIRRRDRRLLPAPWDIAAGAALVVAALAWFGAVGGWLSIVVILVIAVLAAIVASDIDAELGVALLLLVALFWATFPRDSPPQRFLGQVETADRVVIALGDSYMSGEGAGRYELGTNVVGKNVCRRAATAWPLTFSGEQTLSISLACSGAVINNITGDPQYKGEPLRWDDLPSGANQLTQLTALLQRAKRGAVAQVVVGIGGNDLGFSQIGMTCVGAGDCDRPEVSDIWRARLPKLKADLTALFRTLRATLDQTNAKETKLLVVGYPVSMTSEGCWWTMLSRREHKFLVDLISELDATIAAATEGTGATYVPTVATSFQTAHRRLCEVSLPQAGINLLSLNPMQGSLLASLDPRHWVNNTFHPNRRGHDAIRAAVIAWTKDSTPVAQVPVPNVAAPCDPDACDAKIAAWSRQQLVTGATNVALPVGLAFLGWALVWTSLQRFLRSRRVSLTVRIARRLLPPLRLAATKAGAKPAPHTTDLR